MRPHRTAPLALLLLLLPHPLQAQDASVLTRRVTEAVTTDELMAHAREITRYERPSGSPGENAAIDYVVRTLDEAGVPVAVHEIRAFTSDPLEATVTVPGTDVAPRAITVSFSASTDGLEAPLVDVGGLDDLPGIEPGTGERLTLERAPARPGTEGPPPPAGLPDVRGKVVLVDGQPRGAPVAVLERLGAVGVVFANPEERLNDLIVTTTWGTPSLLSYHRLPTLPVAEVARSGGAALRERLARGPTVVRLTTRVHTGWSTLRLAVARIEAPDPGASMVLFGGHIDAWYHGGTDEGASNAAMLALAKAFWEQRGLLRRDLVVAWWPGHSNARYGGSTWFSDHFFDELRRRGVAYVNVDGIGQREAKRFSTAASSALEGLALDVIRRGTGEEARSYLPGRNSDQSFNGAGVPLLQINHTRLAEDGGYWWWHTPDDTYDKIDAAVLKQDSDLYADALAHLLADPVLPVDLVAEVDALEEHLARRRAEMGRHAERVGLGEAERLQQELAGRARALQRALGSAPPGPGLDGPGLDGRILDVLRPIHRAVFVPLTPWHPDPGLGWDPLPGLGAAPVLADSDPESDRFGFALTTLVRERNRLVEALDEAVEAADRLLADLVIHP